LATFILKPFSDLTPSLLYKVLKLRQDVFIIEQNCIYDDIDDVDPYCDHLCLLEGDKLIGYSRIVPAGKKFKYPSIGRIIVSPEERGNSYGRHLIRKSLEILNSQGAEKTIIEAQSHLKNFYESEGFIAEGKDYDVDGIPHVKMWQDNS
jgi:ElaA protein